MKYSNKSILPHNFLAEQAILNILLTKPYLINEILVDLKLETFYFLPHKLIYKTILEIIEQKNSVNLTNLITKLQDNNNLRKIGGIERIKKIIKNYENSKDLNNYIELINEKYLRRLIIELGKELITWGYTTSEKLEVILEKIEQSVYVLGQKKDSSKLYNVVEIINNIYDEINSKINGEKTSGFQSSFQDLDSILQGFQKSDLIIIAGRPSMGKTAFSLNLGKNIVENYNVPLIIFSLEMSRQQIIYRFLSTLSTINASRIRSGRMTRREWKKLTDSMKKISKLPIFIDDNPNLTLLDIRAKLRKIFSNEQKKGIVIIDYLQLMKLNFRLENRVQEISYITRSLKLLAKEFDVPILLLSQLSRSVESRINKRPMLSDLRESGCLTNYKTINNFQNICWKTTSLVNQKLSNFELKGIKPTFIIEFENNIKISLTSNHKILSKNGWISADQIKLKDNLYYLLKISKRKVFYTYQKVKKIKYEGLNRVYDKNIKYYHNYLNNNFVLHNSIEQDADVVIMLYREEYYKENSKKSQLTELIVAKHRNGAIGTAKLLFVPSTTCFQNL
jgi:replicative DNA helicase